MAAKLVVQDLQKRFGDQEVLRGASFTFEQGKIYGLIGRNGAGKTTFFNCLNEDLPRDGGSFHLVDDGGNPRPVTADDMGYVLSTHIMDLALLTGDTDPAAKETQAQYRSKLTLDSGPESRKTGCARFNELFMRRNMRLLMRPARRTAVNAAVVLAAGCAACLISPAAAAAVNGLVVQALPGMLLLMYFINRGNTVTRALFFNCDRSMLCYRFYRQPRVILGIFTARLKSLTAINLLPTTDIALGLPLLLLCSGGTDTPLDYAVLALSILAMSVFFSVHYLVLYYLLQPYTAGLENTSYAYRIITGLTYVVCYLISANVRGSTAFGVGVVLFAAVYVAAALLLAYHLAPRTFKLRT